MKFNTKLILFATVVIAASILYADSAKISVVKSNNILRAESGLEGAKVLKKKKKDKSKSTGPAAAVPAAPPVPPSADLYTVSMLGDIGQFKYYKDSAFTTIPELGANGDISKKLCDTLISSHKNDLMVNFQTLLGLIKSNTTLTTDEAAVLGDSIYVEKKGGGDDLALLRTAESKLVSPHQLVNDIDVIGASTYNNDVTLATLQSSNTTLNAKITELRDREKRLICGWYYLKNHVFSLELSPTWLVDNVNFINGNHSYDIDYKFETEYVNKNLTPKSFMVKLADGDYIDRKKTPLTPQDFLQPRAVSVTKGTFKIQYIDLDPSLLVCSDFLVDYGKNAVGSCANNKPFTDCYSSRMAKSNMPVLDDADKSCNIHLAYLDKTLKLLTQVATEDPDWRIARMHQPIFNVEYDYAGMKYNRLLMEKFKKAHIHAWFVSHFHNAQFTVSLYEHDNYKYKPQSPFKGGLYSTLRGSISVSAQNSQPFTGLNDFLFTKSGPSDPSYKFTPDYKKDAQGKPTTTITGLFSNYNYISWVDRSSNVFNNNRSVFVNKCNEEFVFQFLTGNSGRKLDPLINDKFSDLMLIFGQAFTNQFGYTRFNFYKRGNINCLKGTYLILDTAVPDQSSTYAGKLKEVYTQEICQDNVDQNCHKEPVNFISLLDKNFKKNPAGVNVVVDHLSNTSDPYAADVAAYK